MSEQILFAVFLFGLSLFVAYCDRKYGMLRDPGNGDGKPNLAPYSLSRVQLAWWSIIVISGFCTVTFCRGMPTIDRSALILLGISLGTTGTARVIDTSPQPLEGRRKSGGSRGILLDLLSDKNGPSVHRFQTVVFNLVFGAWFVYTVFQNLADPGHDPILPVISDTNLILLGLSSGGYLFLKTNEYKPEKKGG